MLDKPKQSTHGQATKFAKRLFQELMDAGYESIQVCEMSLSEALLARFGTEIDVDACLGQGTFKGVKQPYGGLVTWRKPWNLVKKQQKELLVRQANALKELVSSVHRCMREAIPEAAILKAVKQSLLSYW